MTQRPKWRVVCSHAITLTHSFDRSLLRTKLQPLIHLTPTSFTRRQWISLFALAAAQFINLLDFMLVMPLGPRFIEEMKISPEQFGHMVASYGFAAFGGGMLASGFIDRFERKRAMLVVFALFSVCTFFCGVANDYLSLVLARAMTGIFGGVVGSMTMTLVSDLFHESRRGFALGIVAVSFAVASIIGVPMSLWVADVSQSVRIPFFALAVVSAVIWFLMLASLPTLRGHILPRPASYWKTLREQFSIPSHCLAYVYTVSLVFGTFTVAPYIATYMVTNVGLRKFDVKYIYIFGGSCTFIAMPMIGKLTDRLGKKTVYWIFATLTIIPTLLITNLGLVSLPLAISVTTLYMTLTSGRMVPAQALIAAATIPSRRAGFMSVNSAIQHLASGMAASLSAAILRTGENNEIVGFWMIGVVATTATLISLPLAGILLNSSLKTQAAPLNIVE